MRAFIEHEATFIQAQLKHLETGKALSFGTDQGKLRHVGEAVGVLVQGHRVVRVHREVAVHFVGPLHGSLHKNQGLKSFVKIKSYAAALGM